MLFLPFLLGLLITRFMEEEKNNILWNIVAGYILAFGLFELIVLPLIALRKSLSLLIGIYGGILIFAAVVSVCLNFKRFSVIFQETIAAIRRFTWVIWAQFLLILGQIWIYVRFGYVDADDSFYVASAATSIATNTIFQYNPYTGELYESLPSRYVLSPFYAFIATVGKAVDNHPAIIAHSVFMILFLIVSYMVYWLIGKKLFAGDFEKTGYFLMIVSLLNIFSGYSEHTSGLFLLIRVWQGKAFLAGILLPLVLYLSMRLFFMEEKKEYWPEWVLLLFLMSACCMVSSMGVILGAIALGISGILFAFRKKSLRILIYTVLCCIPNIICAGIYLVIR